MLSLLILNEPLFVTEGSLTVAILPDSKVTSITARTLPLPFFPERRKSFRPPISGELMAAPRKTQRRHEGHDHHGSDCLSHTHSKEVFEEARCHEFYNLARANTTCGLWTACVARVDDFPQIATLVTQTTEASIFS